MRSIVIFTSFCLIGLAFALPEPIAGGWFTVPVNDETVTKLASHLVEHHNKVSNSLFHKKLDTIVSAKAQVVAGMNYEVTVIIGTTKCSKSDSDAASCEIDSDSPNEQCTYVAWVKLNSDVPEITSGSCKEVDDNIVGGWFPVSIFDSKVIELTAKAIEHYNMVTRSLNYNKLMTIKEAKGQVVAGMNYEITFITKATQCLKSDANAAQCEVSVNGISEECTYNFWDKPYANAVPEITGHNCKYVQ